MPLKLQGLLLVSSRLFLHERCPWANQGCDAVSQHGYDFEIFSRSKLRESQPLKQLGQAQNDLSVRLQCLCHSEGYNSSEAISTASSLAAASEAADSCGNMVAGATWLQAAA